MLPLRATLFAAAIALSSPVHAETVTVFAASSLKDALDQVAAAWQTDTGNTVTISYGGSAALAKQIIEGAPADLYLSASPEWMDKVAAAGLIQPDSRTDLLGNSLVLIAAGADAAPLTLDANLDLPALLGDGKLAMGEVTSVPAGIYGREALTTLGLWDAVESKVAQAENVRAALALVTTGEAPFGIVYGSDVVAAKAAGDAVSAVGAFAPDNHSPIIYPVARITPNPAGAAFEEYLQSDAADAIFTGMGFSPIP
jgi:molybdate transport system substrate-binding protein